QFVFLERFVPIAIEESFIRRQKMTSLYSFSVIKPEVNATCGTRVVSNGYLPGALFAGTFEPLFLISQLACVLKMLEVDSSLRHRGFRLGQEIQTNCINVELAQVTGAVLYPPIP